MKNLEPNETVLDGSWVLRNGEMIEDDVTKRILDLVEGPLVLIGESNSGWDKLYKDPSDCRFWELTYPKSEMHGGGPPRLENLDTESVEAKYGAGVVANDTSARRRRPRFFDFLLKK